MRRFTQARFIVLLLVIGFGFLMAPQWAEGQTRPTPMGVSGGNASLQYSAGGNKCYYSWGTLGAPVADQNGTQYILSAAHVLGMAPTAGFFGSGSNEPIIEPGLNGLGLTSCSQVTPALISQYQVASLTTLVPLVFGGPVNSADAAIAIATLGKVSSSINFIPQFSGVALQVVKKGLLTQMTAASTNNTAGHVVSKMLMTEKVKGCQYISTTGSTTKNCGYSELKIGNSFEVKIKNKPGDSGALVLTTGPCPQPVGVLVAGENGLAVVESIGTTLQALQSAGGYSSLSVVPGGGGCTPSTAEVEDTTTGDVSLEDPTFADPDVAEALVARADMLSNDSLVTAMMNDGYVDGVGIDLSGSTAALDIIFDSSSELSGLGYLFPTSYEGVPVEQSVINTIDTSTDSTGLGSLSN